MEKPKVEATLEFTWKEFISTILSVLVLVLIGYDVKDLIYATKVFDNISITLVISGVFAFTYIIMICVKFGREGKVLAEARNLKNKQAFEEGIIVQKEVKEIPVILPIEHEEDEKKKY